MSGEVEAPDEVPEIPEHCDVSVDLETLDKRPSGVILSLGAVPFNANTGELFSGQSFYAILGATEQVRGGRTIDPDTVAWWMTKPQEAQEEVLYALKNEHQEHNTPVPGILAGFADWCDAQGEQVTVWGNGPSFDNSMLSSLYDTCGLKPPWFFWNEGCVRTAVRTARMLGSWKKPPHQGIAHNALDDAIHQAHVVSSAMMRVRFGMVECSLQTK